MPFGRFPGLALAVLLAAASPLRADDAHPWDASWAGRFADGGQGIQVLISDDQVVGFFVDEQFIDVAATDPIADDGSLTFRWEGGSATLASNGDDRTLTVREDGADPKVAKLKVE